MDYRRVAAVLTVLMINAALLPSAAAADPIITRTAYTTDYDGYRYTSGLSDYLTTQTEISDYNYFYPEFTDPYYYINPTVGVFPYNQSKGRFESFFNAFTLGDEVSLSEFDIAFPSFGVGWYYGGQLVNSPSNANTYLTDLHFYVFLVNSSDSSLVAMSNRIDLGTGIYNTGLSVSFGPGDDTYTFDTVVVQMNFNPRTGVTSRYDLYYARPCMYLKSFPSVSAVSELAIDGTNETLDGFVSSYTTAFESRNNAASSQLNTNIQAVIDSYTAANTQISNDFVAHSGNSTQESVDWGFYSVMQSINNAGSQVTSAVSAGAAATVNAISSGATYVSQNVVAAAETVNTTVQGLPAAIGNTITGLMVPDAQELQTVTQEFNTVMENKLGAVYQIGGYGSALFGSIQNASATDTITFPGVSVPVGSGETFTIDSAEVSIFPSGLSVLQNCVKVIVTGAIVSAWFLGLQGYYNKFFGGGGGDE